MKRRTAQRKRSIAVITGTRAEYGLLQSTLHAIERHPKLELQLVVTGMHLLKEFGATVEQVKRDGWTIAARIPMQKGTDGPRDQADGLARGITGIAAFLELAKSDIVVVLGDRIEAMAGALAAITTGCCLAHIHGGDVAIGDFDESLRHAITKLAHVHFPATSSASRRIVRMGEDKRRVHSVGAPGLDDLADLARRHSPPQERSGRVIVLQHACGRTPEHEMRIMRLILRETTGAGLSPTIIYPNTDRGHTGIVRAIEEFAQSTRSQSYQFFRSLPRPEYLHRLIEADLLIGNSSSGIIEAATAGTAVVNVGDRQKGRQRAGRAIFDAAESARSVRQAIARALKARPIRGRRTAYGDGRAGSRIADLLATVPLDDAFRRKQCTY